MPETVSSGRRSAISFLPRVVPNYTGQTDFVSSKTWDSDLAQSTDWSQTCTTSSLVSHRELSDYTKCNIRSPNQKCYRTGTHTCVTRLVFPSFWQRKARWFNQTDIEPETFESAHSRSNVSHALTQVGASNSVAQPLGGVDRYERCILPSAHSQTGKEVSQVCGERTSVPVQGSSLWSMHSSQNIYQGSFSLGKMGSCERNQSYCIHRRLADSPQRQTNLVNAQRLDFAKGNQSRLDSQPREVGIRTHQGVRLPRHEFQSGGLCGETSPEKIVETQGPVVSSAESVDNAVATAKTSGNYGFAGGTCSASESHEKAFSVCPQGHESQRSLSFPINDLSCDTGAQGVSQLVVSRAESSVRCPSSVGSTNYHTSNRCIDTRLGCILSSPGSKTKLARPPYVLTHKLVRNVGNQTCSCAFQTSGAKQTCALEGRQCNCVGLFEESWRYCFQRAQSIGNRCNFLDSQTQCELESNLHLNRPQCPGRQTQQTGSSSTHRVDAGPVDLCSDLCQMVQSSSRPVRDPVELPIALVCQSVSRHQSACSGCIDVGLECIQQGVSVSTNRAVVDGSKETQRVQRRGNIDCAAGSDKNLSQSSHRSVNRLSSKTTLSTRLTVTGSHRDDLSSKSRTAKPSRVEVIRKSFKDRGFSSEVAQLAAQPQRPSSTARYDFIWSKFQLWCCGRSDRRPHSSHKSRSGTCSCAFKAPVTAVADYLLMLYHKGLSRATILAHKTAICVTIRDISGHNFSNNRVLQKLCQSFKRLIVRKTHSVPDWDLTLVLKALMQKPFEPMLSISFDLLTMKTLFLVAFASAARVSELQALSVKEGHFLMDARGRYVDLLADHNFVAKNQIASDLPRKFRILAIKDFAPLDDPERKLCPVRALRIYKARLAHKRSSFGRLFVKFKPEASGPLTIHAISYLLKQTIIKAYSSLAPDELDRLHRITPHEIRATCTSLAAFKQIPIKDIMKRGFWRSETTFIHFYLKDLAQYLRNDINVTAVAAANCLQL